MRDIASHPQVLIIALSGTLSSSHLDPRIVLIVENDQPGYTLTVDIPGLAVLHGLGDSATNLITLRWLQTADRVLYWGDIDRAGAIVNTCGCDAMSRMLSELVDWRSAMPVT